MTEAVCGYMSTSAFFKPVFKSTERRGSSFVHSDNVTLWVGYSTVKMGAKHTNVR